MADDDKKNSTYGANVHVSSHPVISHKITILRASPTKPSKFRSVLREVTYHLGYEATSKLTTKPIAVSVPVGHNDHQDYTGQAILERVALIPILRSGLGMTDSMLELLPMAAVHHIGMYHIPGHSPVQYFNRLPRQCSADVAFVLDPVIGSGSTILSVVGILKKWGVPKIHIVTVLASETALKSILEMHPDLHITVGTVDKKLENGVVIPGLGDSGDRLFGTQMIEDDEELLHPSKRKRSDADLS